MKRRDDLRQIINESIQVWLTHPLKDQEWCEAADFVIQDLAFLAPATGWEFAAELQFNESAVVTIAIESS